VIPRPGTPRPPHRHLRLATHRRSPPRTAVGARVVPPVDGPANASPDDQHDQLLDASLLPSQPLTAKVLRRPLESALGPVVAMEDQPLPLDLAAPQRVLQRAQHQLGVGPVRRLPAHHPPGERVAHAGQPQSALPGGDARDVGHPQPVGRVGVEVAVDQIRCRCGRRVAAGAAAAALAHERALQAGLAHQPLHPLAADPDALAAQLGMDLGRPIGAAGVGVDAFDLLAKPDLLDVAQAGMAPALKPPVERRDGNLQHPEDGLDPEAVAMGCDEAHDRRRVGSSSWAK
jgi:hypothetical protein